jgi:hypothetical protein
MRNIRLLRLPTVLALLATVAVGATSASAARPVAVSGTYVYTSSVFESFQQAGGNVIIGLTATVEYTGTFTGTSNVHGFIVVHSDGSANFHDVEVFTGTVNGVPGTVTFNLTGSNDSALDVKITSTIVSASGDLSGLTGLLRLAGSVKLPEGPFGTYSGQLS